MFSANATDSHSASLAERLPYLLTRTVATDDGPVGVVVNRDGTVSLGFEAPGLDLYCDTNAAVNAHVVSMMSVVNTLGANAYLQVTYESGATYRTLLDTFSAASAQHGDELLSEGRRHRVKQFASDPALLRLRLIFWVGIKRCVTFHRAPERSFHRGASQLLVLGQRIRDALEAFEWKVKYFREHELVAELHGAVNPSLHETIPAPQIVDTPEDLRQVRAGAYPVWRGNDLAGQLALSSMRVESDAIEFEGHQQRWRAFGVTRFPRHVDVTWLHTLLRNHPPITPFRFTVTHNGCDQGAAEKKHRTISSLYGTLARLPFASTAASLAAEDAERVCKIIGTSEQRFVRTSTVVHVSGTTDAELSRASEAIQRVFSDTKPPTPIDALRREQLPAWLASLPAYGYSHPFDEPASSLQAACTTPMWIPAVGDVEQPDLLFHTRQRTPHALSLREMNARQDSNLLLVGKTGGGKTLLALEFLLNGCLDLGGHAVIADNKGAVNSAYRPLAELYGGRYYNLDPSFGHGMSPCPPVADVMCGGECNPLALSGLAHILWLLVRPPEGQGAHRDYYGDVLMALCRSAYEAGKDRRRPVMLQDIRDAQARYAAPNETAAAVSVEVMQRLDTWCRHALRGPLLNAETPMDCSDRLTIFDFCGIRGDADLCGVLMALLTQRVNAKLNALPRTVQKLLLFDEAWEYLLHFDEAAELLAALARTTRSYGAALHLVTQAGKDLLKSKYGSDIRANLALQLFLRAAGDQREAAEAYGFNARELDLYERLRFIGGEYAEFLLRDINRGTSTVLQFRPTPYHLWNCSTRTRDVELLKRYTDQLGSRIEAVRHFAQKYPHGTPKTPEELELDYTGDEEDGDAAGTKTHARR